MKVAKRVGQIFVIGALAAVLVCGVGSVVSPKVAWRVRLLTLKLTGRIPEIPLLQLLEWMRPRSPVKLERLAYVPNVGASITNSFTDEESAAAGAQIFGRVCASCHGDDARGRTGPNLLAAITSLDDWQFFSTVRWGRPNTIMVPQPLSDRQIWDVGAFLRQTALDASIGKSDSATKLVGFPAVSPQMLQASGEKGDWLTYAGNWAGYRHAVEDQIDRRNVGQLRLAWAAQLPYDGSYQESSPIVDGDRMIVTEGGDGVTALDAANGTLLWQFRRPVPSGVPTCCGQPNRGVAVLGKNVYVATFDAHLLALDGATGSKVWDATVADWHQGYSMTGAPLALGDRIIVGVAGGDFGARGFIAAYSASDGRLLWKFYTVAGPGDPGRDSWGGDSWKHGGGATWVTGAYDPALHLIYWGTGNPAPDFNTSSRPGDDLYTCSVVAVDDRTGKLRWYFQFTPRDDHNWDSNEQPVLVDIPWQGQTTPALLFANRNGFLYALDRRTGRFLYGKPFAKQTWASGLTAGGRPIELPGAHPTPTGRVISPASDGATSWWSPSFDPQRNELFIPSVDSADRYFDVEEPDYREGSLFAGSGFVRAHDALTTVAVRAFDAATGEERWSSTLEVGGGEVSGEMGGLLSTAGNLIFSGHGNEFDALDADTGKVLWRVRLGGVLHAAPISYLVDGRQYVAIFSGRTLFVFGLPREQDMVATPVESTSHRSRRVKSTVHPGKRDRRRQHLT